MGCCSSTPGVPPDLPVVAESAPPRPVAVEVLTPPTPLISEQFPSTFPGGAPPPHQRTRGPTHESRIAPHRSGSIQRTFSSLEQSQPLESLDGSVAQSLQVQRSQSVQALHRDNHTIFTRQGMNIGWRGFKPFNDCLARTQKGGGAGIDTDGAANTF